MSHPESFETGHEAEIDIRDTGVRVLLTVLFVVISGVIDSVLGVLIAFSLLWAAITRKEPGTGVRDLANRAVTYRYVIGRYLTYNDANVPFPFSDIPDALEDSTWSADLREREALGLGRDADDEDDL